MTSDETITASPASETESPQSETVPPDASSPDDQSLPLPAPPVPKCGARGIGHIYLFLPQEDITAREVAASMEIVMFGFAVMMGQCPVQFVDILFARLPEETRRHWSVQELKVQPQVVAAEQPKGLLLPAGVVEERQRQAEAEQLLLRRRGGAEHNHGQPIRTRSKK